MEQDPLVCVAEIEQLADFIGGEAIDIAQGNDLALCRRQLGNGGADVRVQLVGKQLLFGLGSQGRYEPVPGPALISWRPEAVWIDCGVDCTDFLIGKIAERDRSCITHGTASGAVHENPEKPGLERGAALETIEPTQEGEPRFLGNIFGCVVGDVQACQSNQRVVEALNKVSKCQLVA